MQKGVRRSTWDRHSDPGTLGRLEWHDSAQSAAYRERRRLFAPLWAVPGVRRWQVGDQEARGLFPVAAPPAEGRHPVATGQSLTAEAARKRSGLPQSERLQRVRRLG